MSINPSINMSIPTYKVALLGPSEIGKTKWVYSLLQGNTLNKYIPTIGVEVHPITIDVGDEREAMPRVRSDSEALKSDEHICFNVWDMVA